MQPRFRPEIQALSGFALLALLASCETPERAPEPVGPSLPEPVEAAPSAPDPLEEARAEIAAGDLNRALLLLDRARAGHAENPDYWRLYGSTTLGFVAERRAAGEGDVALIDGLYIDAAQAFQEAARLDPGLPADRIGAAMALRERGDFDAAWTEASAAAEMLGAESDDSAALLEIGRTGLAATVAAVQAGEPVPGAARAADAALSRAWQLGDLEAVVPLSDLFAWQGLRDDARRTLVDGLSVRPDHADFLGRLWNLSSTSPDDYVADLEQVRLAAPGHALILWYLGEGRFLQQAQARQAQDYLLAYEALDRAEECYLQAMALEASYEDACAAKLHLVRTARGWALREEGRVDDAGRTFLATLDADPARLEPESTPGSLRLGIDAIVADYFREQRLGEVRHLLARAIEYHDRDPNWTNNLAFACRDLGVAAQQAGDTEEAATLFQQSWDAYSRTVELAPDDVRLVNDRALIAVYYLDEHHELAESELHRAIALGEPQLAGLPEDADPVFRQDLDEAIGDAWENLAYLDLVRRQRTDRAEEYLEKSFQHFPFERRLGALGLRDVLAELLAEDAAGTDPAEGDAAVVEEPSEGGSNPR